MQPENFGRDVAAAEIKMRRNVPWSHKHIQECVAHESSYRRQSPQEREMDCSLNSILKMKVRRRKLFG